MNIFGTVLTHTAPSANYRGESAENRAVIQKISFGRFDYAFISPEAIRNALRETLAGMDLPCNRTRLHDEEQLAVKFEGYPDADRYIDDFFMGWLVAATKSERRQVKSQIILNEQETRGADIRGELTQLRNRLDEVKGNDDSAKKQKKAIANDIETLLDGFDGFVFKRDSILRMNMAVALEPYRHNTVFTQSPQDKSSDEVRAHKNADNSQLLHRETVVTAFQYPFALNLDDCQGKAAWTKKLLRAIGELNGVAGNHARSYYEFAPASIVIRLTPRLVAGFETYAFKPEKQNIGRYSIPDVIDGIENDDWPGGEFFIGGQVVKEMADASKRALEEKEVTLDRSTERILECVGERAFS